MSLDRRVYLATTLVALVGASAMVIAAPQDPLLLANALQTAEDAAPVTWHLQDERNLVDGAPAPADGRNGRALADPAGDGMRTRPPLAIWPVDIRREMQDGATEAAAEAL